MWRHSFTLENFHSALYALDALGYVWYGMQLCGMVSIWFSMVLYRLVAVGSLPWVAAGQKPQEVID